MNRCEKPVTLDAHQHFWDLQRFSYPWMTVEIQALQQYFLPSDLRPILDRVGVTISPKLNPVRVRES